MNDSTGITAGPGEPEEPQWGTAHWQRLAEVHQRFDPMPAGLVARMQAAARSEAALADWDLDFELMVLVERAAVPAGARGGGGAYTLRYAYDGIDLLLRVAHDPPAAGGSPGRARLDGWVVPPSPLRVRLVRPGAAGSSPGDAGPEAEVDAMGRFEFGDLPPGMARLVLLDESGPLATPAFEV